MSDKTSSSVLDDLKKFGSWSKGDEKKKNRPGFLSLGRTKGAEKAKDLSQVEPSSSASSLTSPSQSRGPARPANDPSASQNDTASSSGGEGRGKPEGEGARAALLKFLESNPPLEALQQAAWSLTQRQRVKLISFLEDRIRTDVDPQTPQDQTRQRLMPVLFNLLTEVERDEAIRNLVANNKSITSAPSSTSASTASSASSSPAGSALSTQSQKAAQPHISHAREKSGSDPSQRPASQSTTTSPLIPRLDTSSNVRPRKVSEVNLLEFLQTSSPRKQLYGEALAKKELLDIALNRRLLMEACVNGDTQVIENLLAADLDPNFMVDGETPLILAVKRRAIEVVRLLLSGDRANVNLPNGKKEFALLVAVGGDSSVSGLQHTAEEVLVKLLLESSSIDLHVADGDGNTALHQACRQGNLTIAQLLLRADLDPMRLNRAGRSSVEIAADAGHIEVCWLIKSYNIGGDAALKRKKSSGLGLTAQRKVNPARIRSKLQLLAEKLYGKEKVPQEVEDRLDNVVSLVELVQIEDEARNSRDPNRPSLPTQSSTLTSPTTRPHIRSQSEDETMRQRQKLIKRDSVVDLMQFLKVEPIEGALSPRRSVTYRMKAPQEGDEIDYNATSPSSQADLEGSAAIVEFLKADRPDPDEETVKNVANIIFPSESSNPDRLAKARTVIDLVDFLYQPPTESSADSPMAQGKPPLIRRDSVIGFLEFLQTEAPPIRRAASVLRKKHSKANSLRKLTSSILRLTDPSSQEPTPSEAPRPWLGRTLREYFKADQMPIPAVISQCIAFLVDHDASKVEGIFRLGPESPEEFELLVSSYNKGGKIELNESTDVHVVTRFLKLWLRSLPEPVLPDFEQFAELNHESDLDARLQRAKSLIDELPPQNKFILRAFFDLCFLILRNSSTNLMDADSIANALASPLCESGPSLPPGEQFRRSAAAKLFLAFLIPRTDKLFTEGLMWSPRLVTAASGEAEAEAEDTVSISESSRSEIVAVIENTSLINEMSGEGGRRLGDLIEFIEFLDDAPIIPMAELPSPLSDELDVPDLPQWKRTSLVTPSDPIPAAALANLPKIPEATMTAPIQVPVSSANRLSNSSPNLPYLPTASSSPTLSSSPARSLSRSTAKRALLSDTVGSAPTSDALVAPFLENPNQRLTTSNPLDTVVFLKAPPHSHSSPTITTVSHVSPQPRKGSASNQFQFPRASTLSVMQVGKTLSEIEIQLYMILDSPDATKMFNEFLEREHCAENLEFWLEVKRFKLAHEAFYEKEEATAPLDDPRRLKIVEDARLIYDKFIDVMYGSLPINIDSATNSKIEAAMGAAAKDPRAIRFDIWDRAIDATFKLMAFDSFGRYRCFPEGIEAMEIAMSKDFPTLTRRNSLQALRNNLKAQTSKAKDSEVSPASVAWPGTGSSIDLSAVTPKMWARPDKEGYLFKKGHVRRNWTWRVFKLCKNLLFYFAPNEAMPKGVLDLRFYRTERNETGIRRAFGFSLVPVAHTGLPYQFASVSDSDKDDWIAALKAVADTATL